MDAGWQHAVTRVGDEDEKADDGDEGAELRERAKAKKAMQAKADKEQAKSNEVSLVLLPRTLTTLEVITCSPATGNPQKGNPGIPGFTGEITAQERRKGGSPETEGEA